MTGGTTNGDPFALLAVFGAFFGALFVLDAALDALGRWLRGRRER